MLFVDKYANLTEEVLLKNYPGFQVSLKERGTNVPEIVMKGYWRRLIEQTRENAIRMHGLQDVTPRKRCWGAMTYLFINKEKRWEEIGL